MGEQFADLIRPALRVLLALLPITAVVVAIAVPSSSARAGADEMRTHEEMTVGLGTGHANPGPRAAWLAPG